MKKFLRPKHLPTVVLLASVLGFLLRLWTLGAGPDNEGLYQPQPLAWALLWIVTALTLAAIVLSAGRLKNPGTYGDNFPASVLSAAGAAVAAFAILFSGLSAMTSATDILTSITGIAGVVGGVCMVLVAFARFRGENPGMLYHVVVCLFFALRIFGCCRDWSNEPQIAVFLFPFLASICVMLAAYQLTCFDVGLGKRRHSLFWSLSGIYFCILALPSGEDRLFYCAMAIWLATNLCSLRPLKRKPVVEDAPAEEIAAPEAPADLPEQTEEM